MKKIFTRFLNRKGIAFMLAGLFLFFFAPSQVYLLPKGNGFLNKGISVNDLFKTINKEEPKRKVGGLGNTGTALNYQGIKKESTTKPPAKQAFTSPEAFAGTLAEPGGPILVVYAAANPFSKYATEILLAEGLNAFASADITAVTAGMLNSYDVVIVGDIALTDAQVTLLRDWTNAGGTLIAFSPDPKLAPLLGLTPAGGTLANKYLLVNAGEGPGRGIVSQTMQYQCEADLYILNGATAVATLYKDPNTPTSYPAVTNRTVGTGKAIAFTYDLARSIVYTRQGNPVWAGQKRDGTQGPIRSDDQYFPNWVDLSKVVIPVADEQQRLLVNLILQNARKPLPRFWYLPRGLKAAVVMTGDDHGRGGTEARFRQYVTMSPDNSPEAVADWRAIRGTSYIFPNTPSLTDAEARDFEQQGFEIALHLNTDCANFSPGSLEQNLTSQLAQFAALYPSVSTPVTNRTHCIAWSDWHTQASLEVPKGIRMDCNYYYFPSGWVLDRPGMFSGSGFPMRFADLDGNLINCYQLATQMTDESDQTFPFTVDQLLEKALGPEGYYGLFCANMHTDDDTSVGSDKIIASAKARNVPVITTKQALTWVDGRNGSAFGAMSWNANKLSFTVTVGSGAHRLEGMLPITAATGQLVSLTVNGGSVTPRMETIKGIAYAIFPATPGNYVATYNPLAPPNAGPTVAITSPANGTTLSAPASIAIAANAADADGTVAKVEFFQGTLKLGEDLASPYSFTWNNVPAGTYSLTARATDNAGAVTTSAPVRVTVNATCPCTVFQPADAPAGSLQNDGGPIQVGMRFRASVNGTVTGVRFYKQAGNTGTHIGQLYSNTGALLATAPFVSETASGWQQVSFPSPVPITANTTYVISYHSSSGFYSGTNAGFASEIDRTPLRALYSWEDGPNGVYLYKNEPAFPTNTFGATNYWVDLVFESDTESPNQPPAVAITSPASGATFTAPASIAIAANATDADGTVAKVEFFQGTTKLGEDLTSPYSFTWNNVPAGTYSLSAKATDDDGAVTTSASVSITVNTVPNQPPTVAVTSPASGATFTEPATINITANATDADGMVALVEFFQGTTKLGEDATSPYSFTWNNVPAGTYPLTARATDNAGAVTTSAAVSVTVTESTACPCTVFELSDAPAGPLLNDGQPVQLGMKFRASVDGFVTGVRFYKQAGNTGTHIGQLYSSTGTLLAQAPFVSETASGWQQVNFPSPVSIAANTTYVISYHSSSGFYSETTTFFTEARINAPLKALAHGEDGPNGVHLYSDAPAFPFKGYETANYWVDAVFDTEAGSPNEPPTVAVTSPASGATFTAPASIAITANAGDTDGTVAKVEFFQGTTKLGEDATSPYTFTWNNVPAGTYSLMARATDNAGAITNSAEVSVTVIADCPCTVFKATEAPAGPLVNDGQPVQLGMKFRASVDGFATGVRFYKQAGNSGTHIGQLYSSTGALLAQAPFVGETASGWQQVNFPSPVPIAANTTYVISYHSSSGNYSTDDFGFNQPVVNGMLTGLKNGADGPNGLYLYTNTPAFPTSNYESSNYWVDVVFDTSPVAGSPAARLAIASSKTEWLSNSRQEAPLEVYPNPASDRATVRFVLPQGGAYALGLYDVRGRLVEVLKQAQAQAGEIHAIEVDGAKLAAGLYLLRLQTSKGVRTAKLMLRR